MMEILIILIINGIMNVVNLVIGYKIGSKGNKEIVKVTPIKEVKHSKEDIYQNEKELKKIEDIFHNIDIYDGTGLGQREV